MKHPDHWRCQTTSSTTTTPTTTPSGEIHFRGDFETGDYSQWTWGAQCANTGTPSDTTFTRGTLNIVTDVVSQGVYSARVDLPASSLRSACEVLRKRTLNLETDDWYAQAIRFPANWTEPGGWGMTLNQFNYQGVWGPPFQFVGHADNVRVVLQTGYCVFGSGCAYNNGSVPTGGMPIAYAIPPGQLTLQQWHEFVVHVRWTTTTSGIVEVWHRLKGGGWTKTASVSGFPTVQWTDGYTPSSGNGTSDKIGAYRGASPVALSVWHDGFCVASTFAAAESCLG